MCVFYSSRPTFEKSKSFKNKREKRRGSASLLTICSPPLSLSTFSAIWESQWWWYFIWAEGRSGVEDGFVQCELRSPSNVYVLSSWFTTILSGCSIQIMNNGMKFLQNISKVKVGVLQEDGPYLEYYHACMWSSFSTSFFHVEMSEWVPLDLMQFYITCFAAA